MVVTLAVLRSGLVGDVPLAARDPYKCSGVIFPKKVPMFRDFTEKRYPCLGILLKKVPIFSDFFKIFQGLQF